MTEETLELILRAGIKQEVRKRVVKALSAAKDEVLAEVDRIVEQVCLNLSERMIIERHKNTLVIKISQN